MPIGWSYNWESMTTREGEGLGHVVAGSLLVVARSRHRYIAREVMTEDWSPSVLR
jgi:hypothetical protein